MNINVGIYIYEILHYATKHNVQYLVHTQEENGVWDGHIKTEINQAFRKKILQILFVRTIINIQKQNK